jgi:hypothetical protein
MVYCAATGSQYQVYMKLCLAKKKVVTYFILFLIDFFLRRFLGVFYF